jgi:DNA topoisomerase I
LEMAIGLLALPRLLGNHPETGGKIQAGLGRFGPYVVYDQGKDGKEFRSLKSTDDVLTVDLDRAVELLAEPKKGRGAGKSKAALRELGPHPKDQEAVSLFEGPYGIYIKHGKLNASLPEGQTVETLTMELAIEALDAKAATKGKGKGKSAAKSSSKPAAKKATAKKTTTQKAADKSVDPEDAIVKADAKAKATKAATKTTATKKPAAKSTAAKATATKATATKATAAKKPASKIMMKKTAEVPKAVGE